MRNLKRNMLLAGAGVAVFLVVGAALISPREDGDYHLQIYQEGNAYKLRGKPGNNPAEEYRLSRKGRIDWTFTNATDNDTLRVWIDNLNCDGNPDIDCPLDFDEPSSSCGSVEKPLKKGEMQTIGAFDVGPGTGGRCKQDKRPDTWGYDIKVRTITPPSIGTADPQLVIVRDGLTKFLDSIKFMLRSVKRLLHL